MGDRRMVLSGEARWWDLHEAERLATSLVLIILTAAGSLLLAPVCHFWGCPERELRMAAQEALEGAQKYCERAHDLKPSLRPPGCSCEARAKSPWDEAVTYTPTTNETVAAAWVRLRVVPAVPIESAWILLECPR